MNERIREIWENNDSISVVWPETGSPVSVSAKTLEKFAELIVKECASRCVLAPIDYICGEAYANRIKQHFGVEE